MTQEEKDLLLKDLCARLYTCNCMYGTALVVALADEQPLESNQWLISNYDCYNDKFIVSNIVYASDVERIVDIDNIRPYLFPMSSMTEEIMNEIYTTTGVYDISVDSSIHIEAGTTFVDLTKIPDILHKHHIDCGLIPMGLAIDATDLNIY